ncbi:MAG TPA: hypothetical protein VFQ61_36910 [Polyangiaceae bacterium]|nr:hypothetical protein [Polyangiaceae bacterium]
MLFCVSGFLRWWFSRAFCAGGSSALSALVVLPRLLRWWFSRASGWDALFGWHALLARLLIAWGGGLLRWFLALVSGAGFWRWFWRGGFWRWFLARRFLARRHERFYRRVSAVFSTKLDPVRYAVRLEDAMRLLLALQQ